MYIPCGLTHYTPFTIEGQTHGCVQGEPDGLVDGTSFGWDALILDGEGLERGNTTLEIRDNYDTE